MTAETLTPAQEAIATADCWTDNAVLPTYTALLEALPKEAYDGLVTLHPVGRLGTSEEVAALVDFLCQPARSTVPLDQSIAALARLMGHAG